MKLAIMQPYYFPYLGYFQLIKAVDKFILYDNINYIKNGWVNRNRLLEVNRKPVYVTVPLNEKSSFSKIREIEIDNGQPWKKKLLKMLNYNYRRSAYYAEIYSLIEKSINYNEISLSKFNCYLIKSICTYLDIATKFDYDVRHYEGIEKAMSNLEKANVICGSNRMTTRVIEICRHENARTYVNAIGGMELYSKEVFVRAGIDLYFLKTLPYSYKQNTNEYFQHLSIIDVLMNCGREETKRMLEEFELV